MKHLACLVMPILFLGGIPALLGREANLKSITLSVRDADWKDVLRAALENSNLNLSFDQGLETRVQGLDLKGVTLEELLDDILPGYGLGYVRTGRSIHIVKSDGGLRFYQVDSLALRRLGSKEFSVSASGQAVQSGSSGGGGGGQSSGGASNSAYSSTLQSSNDTDPWQELQVGLRSLIFGAAPPEPQTIAHPGGSGAGAGGPASTAYHQDGKTLLINPGSGVVAVAADPGTQHTVERFLTEMERRSRRQVLLEARIVEVSLTNDSQMGVDWNSVLSAGSGTGGPGTSITGGFVPGTVSNPQLTSSDGLFTLGVANARVSATLTALARDGRLKVLSSPRLTALNNQKAILRVVQEQPYFLSNSTTSGAGSLAGSTTSVNITPIVVPVGIVLDIQAQIADNGDITLSVNPSVTQVARVESDTIGPASSPLASANLPVVDRRDLDTVVRIQSGQTLVLAGIIKTSDSVDNRGVPWLKDIPFLGALFKQNDLSKSRTELAIFITPTLLEDPADIEANRQAAEQRLKDAGADANPPGKATKTLQDR